MDSPRYEHLNERQMKSEEKFKSFQSVWIKGKHRECKFDEQAPPDPDPMDEPSVYNPNCLYGVDDITIKYEISLKLNLTPKHVTRENGRVDIVKKPKHVKWKWLYQWGKSAQVNFNYKQLVTPWGTFQLFNHNFEKIHFPTREDPRCIARFSTQFFAYMPPGKLRDPVDGQYKTYEQYQQIHQGRKLPVFEGFQRPVPIGCKDVKWESVRDTYRYCFIFDHVLDDKDRAYTIFRDRILHSAKEMIGKAIYYQFNGWFSDMCDHIEYERSNGISRYTPVAPNRAWNTKECYCLLKDVPTEDEFENWNFHLGWTQNRDDTMDREINNEAAFKALQYRIEKRRRELARRRRQ